MDAETLNNYLEDLAGHVFDNDKLVIIAVNIISFKIKIFTIQLQLLIKLF